MLYKSIIAALLALSSSGRQRLLQIDGFPYGSSYLARNRAIRRIPRHERDRKNIPGFSTLKFLVNPQRPAVEKTSQ